MFGKWTQNFSFVCAALIDENEAFLALSVDEFTEDKVDFSLFAKWTPNLWKGGEHSVNWTTISACPLFEVEKKALFMGYWGELFFVNSTGSIESKIHVTDKCSPENRGPMRKVRNILGRIYAVGMGRQVYRFNDSGIWDCIDETCYSVAIDPENTVICSFEDIDGFSDSELYAVGLGGEIWCYNGNNWKQLDSPTSIPLTNISCAEDGYCYISGRAGIIVRGRNNKWEIIEHNITNEDFWSSVWFNGRLFLSTTHLVYEYTNSKLINVEFGDYLPESCYSLCCLEKYLWSIGAKDVMRFDGDQWERID